MAASPWLAIALLALACGSDPATADRLQPTGEFRLSASFVPEPSVTGKNSLAVTLSEAAGSAVEGASFDIEPWMPAHGHGSSSVPQVVEIGAGEYQSDDLIFTMPGAWEVRIAVSVGARHDYFVLEREVQ